MSASPKHLYQFGVFTIDTDQRVLLREGKPQPLAPKVFETLLILVENNGRIVAKDELMSRLWPDTFVEEANLTFNIQQIRKCLGDNARKPSYVETVARRGYRFIADVKTCFSDTESAEAAERARRQDAVTQGRLQPAEDKSTVEVESSDTTIAQNLERPSVTATARIKVTVLVAALIILVAIAVVFWEFPDLLRRSLNTDKRAGPNLLNAPALKLDRLTETGQSRLAAISPDGKYVAYTRAFGKQMGIWLRQLATNTNVEIVPAGGLIYGIAFTNNGDYLYFVKGDPILALYRVPLVGGVPSKVADKVDTGFCLSSDDTHVVFIRLIVNREGQQQNCLVVANGDGSAERTLMVTDYPKMVDAPIWSPDDQSIICAYGNWQGGGQDVSIVEVNANDGTERGLCSEKFFRIRKMAWLAQKKALIICGRKQLGGNNQLWRVSYPCMEITQLTEGLSPYLDLSIATNADVAVASQANRLSDIWAGPANEPRNLKRITQATDEFCWTPNGRLIYPSTASGNWDLWITQPDSTEQRQLTNDPSVDKAPTVTPDNRYIIFTSNRTGELQLWRMNIDGTNQTKLTNRGPADHAKILPDAKSVIYNTTDDCRVWKIPIEGGDPVPVVNHWACFPAVSPDGKMIAFVARNEPKTQLSIAVESFDGGALMKEFEFAGGGLSGSRIQWTPDSKALIYAVERKGPTALMKQFLEGGPPQEIVDFGSDDLFDFGYSIDGKFLAVTRGVWQHDIVLINDLNR
ncbi:MAG TPA: winged helix-turn-helix domain-containing protein [Blastocatellia bacterium]|nr:winged helix-turn-helix domain-containing protein [Blastocatellia bacterium]